MNGWKVVAIIFIVLFSLETLMWVYSFYMYEKELKETKYCYYDVCADYPEASYEEGICWCYDYDLVGNYKIVKTEVIS